MKQMQRTEGMSIRVRLTAWYAAILAATFLALGLGVWAAIRKNIDDAVNSDLQSRVERMAEFLGKFHGNQRHIAEEMREQAALTSVGTALRLQSTSGAWIYRSPGTEKWSDSLGSNGIDTAVIADEKFRVITAAVPGGRLQIGVPFDGYEEVLEGFAWTMILASPLALLLASAGGYWMSRRALAPVERIAETAREISVHRLSERLPVRAAGDELDQLSETLNAMFERLEASFRQITQFTADASHELRTPVAIIRTTAEIATSRPREPHEHVESWKRVIAESERTTRLLDDLMALARADAGAGPAELETVNFAGCVREACLAMSGVLQSANLHFWMDIPPAAPILGDGEALRRLCLILLDNAVKYTAAGGAVSVKLAQSGKELRLEVRDTGVGISPEEQPFIFQRFYRVSKDRSRKTGGAGLGLAIAQWIVTQHHGSIELDSLVGRGSAFRVVLPAAAEADPIPTEAARTTQPVSTS